MGPFPHTDTPAAITADNPIGTNGFEFVEFAHPDPQQLDVLFRQMGFAPVAKHKNRDITLYRQGDVTYVLNADAGSFGGRFVEQHGPCAPSMAWRVADAQHAFDHAVKLGATPYTGADKSINAPAIMGIGDSLLYFVDRYGPTGTVYDDDYAWLPADTAASEAGLFYLDHLTNNVMRGNMDCWFNFYCQLFNFRQIRFFDIEGRHTGLYSRALTSPCGKIRIPINESADDKSQIEEYIQQYNGEGIQHIACGSHDIYQTVEELGARGLNFMPAPPQTYYDRVDGRLPNHGEPLARLARSGILIDGEAVENGAQTKVLLQIFSATVIGPIFFEFIQRKGDEGFGEGNFRALFESIEEDQIRRGVLKVEAAE